METAVTLTARVDSLEQRVEAVERALDAQSRILTQLHAAIVRETETRRETDGEIGRTVYALFRANRPRSEKT